MARVLQNQISFLALLMTMSVMVGCELVESTGTTETSVGTPVTVPPTFTVSPDPNTSTSVPPEEEAQNTPTTPEYIEEGLVINGGALKTKDSQLQLELITLNRNLMKITTNQDCSGGAWEPWVASKSIATPALNTMNTVSVQYRDWDGMITRCYRATIIHDSMGPQILFSKYPAASLEEGATADIIANITDAGTVKNATCSMNQLVQPCHGGENTVHITELPAGDYVFAVHAEDDLGNVSDKSVSWKVVSTTRKLTSNILVNNYKKVDILIVIDNSGSMEYEQKNMGQRTGKLLSVLAGLDYQIAVTTTDPRDIALGDGRFIPISGANGQTILDTTTPIDVAQTRLSATLQRPETGSGEEQAIYVTYRAVERYVANDAKARAFFREGAQFAVLVISDEDESADTAKNDSQNLLNLVSSTFKGQKMFSFHSIITKPGDTACKSTNGYAYGYRYSALSQLTGGVIGSVCESDYSVQVTGIAQGIRNLLKTLTLQCAPVAGKPIVLKKDGVVITPAFSMEGVNMKFTTELDPGNYSVDYSCLKN